jgi:hypothetical protein
MLSRGCSVVEFFSGSRGRVILETNLVGAEIGQKLGIDYHYLFENKRFFKDLAWI